MEDKFQGEVVETVYDTKKLLEIIAEYELKKSTTTDSDRIAELEAKIDDLESGISDLLDEICDKDDEIEGKVDEIYDKSIKIESLERELRVANERIAELSR